MSLANIFPWLSVKIAAVFLLFDLILMFMYGAEIVAAGIGALGSVGSALASGAANAKWTYNQLKTLHDYEKENADIAYQRQLELASGYTPAAMVKKYREAGLNPALMDEFGGNPGTVQSPGTSAGAGASSNPYVFSNIGAEAVSAYNSAKQSQVADAQARLLNAQGVSEEISNNYKVQKEINSLLMQEREIDKLLADKDLSDSQRAYYNEQKDFLHQSIQMNLETWDDQKQAYQINNQKANSEQKVNEAHAALLATQDICTWLKTNSDIKVNDATAASIYQGIKESSQRIQNMIAEKGLTDEQVKTESKKQAEIEAQKILHDDQHRLFPQLVRKIDSEIRRNNTRQFGTFDPANPLIPGMGVDSRPDSYELDDGRTVLW